jgi:hypothetical protein
MIRGFTVRAVITPKVLGVETSFEDSQNWRVSQIVLICLGVPSEPRHAGRNPRLKLSELLT